MSADEFRGRVNHDIQTMFQWTEEVWGREGIIDDDRQSMSMSNVTDGIEVRDIDGRIAECFDIDCLGLFCDRCFDLFRMVGLTKWW